jgi:hypothetical protein
MEDKNIGKTFGIYTIIGTHTERAKDGHLLYVCECNVCNTKVIRRLTAIKLHNNECKHTNCSWMNRRIGKIFNKMVERCYKEGSKDYRWYGEKGIKIYQQWLDNPQMFEEWALRNGYTDDLTIDRIESNKDYCPENCQWIPMSENSRKAGNVNWLTINGETLTGKQWAAKLGLGIDTINKEIRKYGVEKTKELIQAMLKTHPSTKSKNVNQSWFTIYGIQT